MFPSKSMVDYMTEMNRLFAKTREDEVLSNSYNPNFSPFNQSAMGNRSSSSADSISPESYMDFRPDIDNRPEKRSYPISPIPRCDNQKIDTPLIKRHRPIIGRKIIANPEPSKYEVPKAFATRMELDDAEIPGNVWQMEDPAIYQRTPPNANNFFIDKQSCTQNVFYELFPSENKGFEFKTPIKVSPTVASSMTPSMTNVSPNLSNVSPTSFINRSPVRYPTQFNLNKSPTFPPNFGPRFRQEIRPSRLCTFCRKNGETPVVYMTHSVKERVGNRQIVTCPILRSHVCSTCGASGDDAHTITYCPVLRSNNNGQPLPSTTITLKNTRVKSNGRRRF